MYLYLTFPSASSLHVLSPDERGVKPLKISKCLSTTWKSFTDGTFEPDSEVPVSICGLIVQLEGSVQDFFGKVCLNR